MTLRTPHRRISPRTKQKYRAIKDFLRRALGTSSQGDVVTSSSIEVSVSDLKDKIEGIEHQLNKVSEHCKDLATLKENLKKESINLTTPEKLELETIQKVGKSKRNLRNVGTKLLYQRLNRYDNHNKNDDIINITHEDKNGMTYYEPTSSKNLTDTQIKTKSRRSRKCNEMRECYERHNYHKSKYITPAHSTSSFHSLVEHTNKDYVSPNFSSQRRKLYKKKEYIDSLIPKEYRSREMLKIDLPYKGRYEIQNKDTKNKRNHSRLNEDFIADIIEKQYKPVKLFGKRYSDYSQFSAPVCRDQEFTIQDEVQEGSELCSCFFNDNRRQKHRYIRSSDLSDMRSICDTRLYSSKRHRNHITRRYIDDYNNSALYDVVPVKEKSSPKSRRKFVENNIMTYHCKEVPPSPRTHRPRLNLKVQNYAEYEESLVNIRRQSRKQSPMRQNFKQTLDKYESDLLELQKEQKGQNESSIKIKPQKSTQIQEEIVNISSSQLHDFINNPLNISNNDTTLNTQATDINFDKTDKTLSEIKDILQNFLIEIKKESTHDQKSNSTSQIEAKSTNVNEDKIYTNMLPNTSNGLNYNIGQCSAPPFLPTFPNPCCYPIIPMCPMNCLQNGYIIPNPSFTCVACAKNSKENTCPEKESSDKNTNSSEIKRNTETQELIKEIYKFVSQNPKSPRKIDENSNKNSFLKNNNLNLNKNLLTNRSVGDSTKAFKHDAMIGTTNMKCYSKSCEAIGSIILSDVYHTTNTSYSDTVVEKLSLEATQSSTESDVSANIPVKRGKRSRFKNVLKSLRLFRKGKNVIEELSESESTAEVNKPKPPFKQHIMNYAVHGQEYFHPPPIPKPHFFQPHEQSYNCDHRNNHNIPQPLQCNKFYEYQRQYYDPATLTHRNHARYSPPPSCHNYDPHYNQLQHPQVPLCLKEIEVKSIGTQSERKVSIFRKFTKKIQPPVQQDATQQYNSSPLTQNKLSLWQSLQEKAKQQTTNPLTYSLKTQKQLAQGDMKLRNAMIKKLFHKRNPFSPRNLIVRTLLGKDKSSFGDPPKMYRPRMFL